jgi:trans-aconitate 2-methyltransferase
MLMDWDAERYHRLSEPQFAWGRQVLRRLSPRPGERILDLGCGTGRLTAELIGAMGEGHVVGVDRSESMLAQAAVERAWLHRGWRLHDAAQDTGQVHLVRADAAHLPFADVFDGIFSAATFHWVKSHEELFASIYRALVPGGRLVAQCGGGPNLDLLLTRAHTLMDSPRYRCYFDGWFDPWNFADVPATLGRLERAGFTMIDVTLEAAPTTLPDADTYKAFLSTVCVRHHVARLPEHERPSFLQDLAALAAEDSPAFTLDYWRLNMFARKPAVSERAA